MTKKKRRITPEMRARRQKTKRKAAEKKERAKSERSAQKAAALRSARRARRRREQHQRERARRRERRKRGEKVRVRGPRRRIEPPGQPPREGRLWEVRGLVSVEYNPLGSDAPPFHAEMRFVWRGSDYDDERLLDNAVNALIGILPKLDRIPQKLIDLCVPDFSRRGTERGVPYSGPERNRAEVMVFIPFEGRRPTYSDNISMEG